MNRVELSGSDLTAALNREDGGWTAETPFAGRADADSVDGMLRAVSSADAEAFVTTRGTVPIRGTEDWATYSVQIGGLPAGIDQITVDLMYLPNSSGVVYFDDAVLSATRSD